MNKKAPNLGQLDQLSTTPVENHWNQTRQLLGNCICYLIIFTSN